MDDFMKQMANKLKKNPALLRTLMQSQDGQNLMQNIQRIGGDDFQQAVQSASKGNPTELSQMIQQMMRQPSGAELVERIRQAVMKQP